MSNPFFKNQGPFNFSEVINFLNIKSTKINEEKQMAQKIHQTVHRLKRDEYDSEIGI